MSDVNWVKDLFIRPAAVRKGDFVLQLSAGVEAPAQTVADYVATPSLVDALDRAMGLVGAALGDGRSKGSYLHGSFGSGKSHFMAVLSLLLRGEEHAWQKPELHGLRKQHGFAGQQRLLQLHFHMIGKTSLESALLGHYVEHVRAHHPEAPTPALFADDALFDNARDMLSKVGPELFFARLNEADGESGGEAWGGYAGGWDQARFDLHASSGDPKAREKLFDVLTRSWFNAYTASGAYLDLDSGLSVLCRHAQGLGYAGVVLFLDELILWLAHRASEHEWMHDQVQKMVKLVESEHAERAIPIVSFIARQRDLADMVGDDYAGLDAKRLRDSLKHWEGRFDTIGLQDTNLPTIVEKRVLKPQPGAEARLDQAFGTFKRSAGGSWQPLLGQWDEAAFRKLYPFSPALIDALVALSSYLQRERTAIKLLMELLVDHIEDLPVGEVVRVGDLFDALIDGTDAADGAPRARFHAARELYTHKLLPLLQAEHGTRSAERCQRERPERRVRLGCAGCPEKPCRTDNRLVKTLLIAALVPNVRALSDLTASRLVALNHGSIKVPIPGTEAAQATAKLRKWSAQLSQFQLGKQSDPTVRLSLESVDALEILRRAAEFDNPGARQRVLRAVLFEALGIDPGHSQVRYRFKDFRGSQREGDILFGNVRRMTDEQLRCAPDSAFRIVIDYPFDEPDHSPHEDEQRVDTLTEQDGAGWTLVLLPSFFSAEVNHLLGELTVLDVMLGSQTHVAAHTSHLPVDQQARARHDLENLRNAKRHRLEDALEQAYGLKQAQDSDIDPSLRVERHLRVLKPGAVFHPAQPSSLATALDVYLPALLGARWPRHPEFTRPLTPKRVGELLQCFEHLLNSPDKELALTRPELEDLRGTLGQLGIVQVTERVVRLAQGTGPLFALEQRRTQLDLDPPTAGQLRGLIDEGGRMGLLPEASDLILRCYARLHARAFMRGDAPYSPRAGQPIPDDVVLEQPPLPTQTQWHSALNLAGQTLGITLAGKMLHADNLKALEAAVQKALTQLAGPAQPLPGQLGDWMGRFGVESGAPRLVTAQSAHALCVSLVGQGGKALVEAMAAFSPQTSGRAVGDSLARSADNLAVLRDGPLRATLQRLQGDLKDADGADRLLAQVQAVLRKDELNEPLAPRLRALGNTALELSPKVDPEPTPPEGDPEPISSDWVTVAHRERFAAESGPTPAERLRKLAAMLEENPDRAVHGELKVLAKKAGGDHG